MVKTATAKRAGRRKKIYQSEKQRDSLMQMSISQNVSAGYPLDCDFLLHRMFVHAVARGQKEHDCAIYCNRQEQLPARDLEAELSAVELIYTNLTREEIAETYCDVY